jgi:hypothetical protein
MRDLDGDHFAGARVDSLKDGGHSAASHQPLYLKTIEFFASADGDHGREKRKIAAPIVDPVVQRSL